MVTHIVFWKLKDEALGKSKLENAQAIKAGLEALVGVIPGLIEARVGINENDGKYDAALYSRFENWDSLMGYDIHPEHLKIRAFVKEVRLERESVDFEE